MLSKGPCESTKSFRGGLMNVPIASRRVAQDKQTPTSVFGFIVLSSVLQGNIMFPWQRQEFRVLSRLKLKDQTLGLQQ